MSHVKSLTLTVAPHQIRQNPRLVRRQRLIDRLEEQRKLAADPSYTVISKRWIKDEAGVKQLIEIPKRPKPWWRDDGTGNLVLILRNGLKTIEIEKVKPAIVVGSKERLDGILMTLIAALKAGELDGVLEKSLMPKTSVKSGS